MPRLFRSPVALSLLAAPTLLASFAGASDTPPYAPRAPEAFVNWETPHVHPIDLTPDRSTLLVVNTAAARLELFDLSSGAPVWAGAVSVGLDPVTVRAKSNGEAWVVNHVSDSVSIVDLASRRVTRTLRTQDEPCDVVFAGAPSRAFISCSQVNLVQVWDPANLDAAPVAVPIDGEDPRALAVSPDGLTVYAAIFESGNRSTILGGGSSGIGTVAYPPNAVSDPLGPYSGMNPPPNSGLFFAPAIAPGLPAAPGVGLIVRKNASNQWMDDNGRDWTSLVSGPNASRSGRLPGWDLQDHDLAVISTSNLNVSYATGLMNICMAVGVNPASGQITVVGTDATNEVRFEPNVNGRFIRVDVARVNPVTLDKTVSDLNPHLTYAAPTVPQSVRDQSVGDPRAIAWNAAGTLGFVSGMGSNNVIVINSLGARAGLAPTIPVGEGPTGLVLDESRGQLYVLDRFEGALSVVSLSAQAETARIPFFDPTPAPIKVGRKHLYDTHKNSGLGQISCASCHIDGRMDRLAWDLGDPSGAMDPLNNLNLGAGVPGIAPGSGVTPYSPFHPMKGPMTTQTLQGIIGLEPLHWRGDRDGLENFAPAFLGLQGDDATLTTTEMQEFENFLASIHFPPNPNRNFDNSLRTSVPLPGHYTTGRFTAAGNPLPNGNAVNGLTLYRSTTRRLDNGALACVSCHTLPTGAGTDYTLVGNVYTPIATGPQGQHHIALVSSDGSTQTAIKIPQIRNAGEKTGFNTTKLLNNAGFGYLHDGSVDSLERFIAEPIFRVNSDQEVADITAFVLSLTGSELPQGSTTNIFEPPGPPSIDSHAAVGQQTTLRSTASPEPGQLALITTMIAQANLNKVGLIVKASINGQPRGYAYSGSNTFQSDRAGETISAAALQALAGPGQELTYTVVPFGSQSRLGIDADLDGILDADEVPPCNPDLNADGNVDQADVDYIVNVVSGADNPTNIDPDFNRDGNVDQGDVDAVINVVAGAPCP